VKHLLRLGKAAASLVEIAESEQRTGGLGIEVDGFLEAGLGRVPLLPLHLQHGQTEVRVGAGGIQLERLLHVGEGRGGVVSGRIVAGARQVDLGVVGLFLDEQVEMFPGFREATAEDQEVGHVRWAAY